MKKQLTERLQELAGIRPLYKINEGPAVPGDANGDGNVDQADVDMVTNNWLQQGSNIPGDVNNDEIVNLDDLTMVINNFTDSSNGGPGGPTSIPPSWTNQGPWVPQFQPADWWTNVFAPNLANRQNQCKFLTGRIRNWESKLPAGGGNIQQPGDSNNDGIVNQTDMDYVEDNWLQPGGVHGSTDHTINMEDLTLVINNWMQGTLQIGPKLRNTIETKIEMATNHSNTIGCAVTTNTNMAV